MLFLYLTPLLGALMNRVRGGLIEYGSSLALVVFMTSVYLVSKDVYLSLAATLGMWLGESFRWGRYIGALGGWEDQPLRGVALIDFFIKPLLDTPKRWGFVGLTLRGFLWTGIVGLFTVYFVGVKSAVLLSLSGLLMGVCYWLTTMYWNRSGWPYGEWLFGAVLWPSILTSIYIAYN